MFKKCSKNVSEDFQTMPVQILEDLAIVRSWGIGPNQGKVTLIEPTWKGKA